MPRSGTLAGSPRRLFRQVDDDEQLGRGERRSTVLSDAGRLLDDVDIRPEKAAGHLARRPASHDDRAPGGSRVAQHRLEPFGDRQHRDQHDDDARDADDADGRRAEALRNRPKVEERDGDDLPDARPSSVPPQRVGDAQAHGLSGWERAGQHARAPASTRRRVRDPDSAGRRPAAGHRWGRRPGRWPRRVRGRARRRETR